MNEKKNRLPEFVMDKDMKPIYKALAERYPDGYPEILVYDELENGKEIMCNIMLDGRKIYSVKNQDNETLLGILFDELDNPHCMDIPSFPYMPHNLSDKQVLMWLTYASYVADALDIDLQQVMFTDTGDPCGYSGEMPTIISGTISLVEMLIAIPHELRHAWQEIHHPEWFENYISARPISYKDLCDYRNHISEVDAEAFGIKVESMVTGIALMETQAGNTYDPELRKKIIRRMSEIDIKLPKKNIWKIRKIIELDKILASLSEDVMVKKASTVMSVEVYATGVDNFMVDVVYFNDHMFETWLYRKDCGIKTFMFGGSLEDVYEIGTNIPRLIEDNVDSYSKNYEEEIALLDP